MLNNRFVLETKGSVSALGLCCLYVGFQVQKFFISLQ